MDTGLNPVSEEEMPDEALPEETVMYVFVLSESGHVLMNDQDGSMSLPSFAVCADTSGDIMTDAASVLYNLFCKAHGHQSGTLEFLESEGPPVLFLVPPFADRRRPSCDPPVTPESGSWARVVHSLTHPGEYGMPAPVAEVLMSKLVALEILSQDGRTYRGPVMH